MTHRERLERLLFLLKQEQEKPSVTFDITQWEGDCGTSACAVGLACIDPVLQAEGLKLSETQYGVYLEPTFEGAIGFEAAQKFFGFGRLSEALHLFDGDTYPHPEDVEIEEVIERLEEVIERIEEISEEENI